MAFDGGSVVGSLQLKIDAWTASVKTIKSDLDAMAKASGLSTSKFGELKGTVSSLGISLKNELEAKLRAAEAALQLFSGPKETSRQYHWLKKRTRRDDRRNGKS
jgi:hypothetical protein